MLPGLPGSWTRPSELEPAERTAAKKAVTHTSATVIPTAGVQLSSGTRITPIPSAARAISGRRGYRAVRRLVFVEVTRNTTDPIGSSNPTVASPRP